MDTNEMLQVAAKELSSLETRFARQGLRLQVWLQASNHKSVLWFPTLADDARNKVGCVGCSVMMVRKLGGV